MDFLDCWTVKQAENGLYVLDLMVVALLALMAAALLPLGLNSSQKCGAISSGSSDEDQQSEKLIFDSNIVNMLCVCACVETHAERASFCLICTMAVEYTSTLMLYINRLWMYRDLIVYYHGHIRSRNITYAIHLLNGLRSRFSYG